jgi:hypothetical protein
LAIAERNCSASREEESVALSAGDFRVHPGLFRRGPLVPEPSESEGAVAKASRIMRRTCVNVVWYWIGIPIPNSKTPNSRYWRPSIPIPILRLQCLLPNAGYIAQ